MSDEGFKMIETKSASASFNTFNKGVNLMNQILTFVIGYATEINSKDFKDKVTLWMDVKTSLFVLG